MFIDDLLQPLVFIFNKRSIQQNVGKCWFSDEWIKFSVSTKILTSVNTSLSHKIFLMRLKFGHDQDSDLVEIDH